MEDKAVSGQPGNKSVIKGKEFRRFRCTLCPASSSRKFNLQRHMKSHHPGYGENYILDLTPKERGNQSMKVSDKSNSSFVFNDSPILNDDFSNNSDNPIAMDLSSPPGSSSFNYHLDSPETKFPSGMENRTVSDSAENLSSTGTNENERKNRLLTPVKPPVVKALYGKMKSDNAGKGRLDQVLFSKFGCYTKMNEAESGLDELNSDLLKAQPVFVMPEINSKPETNLAPVGSQQGSDMSTKTEVVIPTVVENNDLMESENMVQNPTNEAEPSSQLTSDISSKGENKPTDGNNKSQSEIDSFNQNKVTENEIGDGRKEVNHLDKSAVHIPETFHKHTDNKKTTKENMEETSEVEGTKTASNTSHIEEQSEQVIEYVFKRNLDNGAINDAGNEEMVTANEKLEEETLQEKENSEYVSPENDIEESVQEKNRRLSQGSNTDIETSDVFGNDPHADVDLPNLDGGSSDDATISENEFEEDGELQIHLENDCEQNEVGINDNGEIETGMKVLRSVSRKSTEELVNKNVSPPDTRTLRSRPKPGGSAS